jgi:hypothetical protein
MNMALNMIDVSTLDSDKDVNSHYEIRQYLDEQTDLVPQDPSAPPTEEAADADMTDAGLSGQGALGVNTILHTGAVATPATAGQPAAPVTARAIFGSGSPTVHAGPPAAAGTGESDRSLHNREELTLNDDDFLPDFDTFEAANYPACFVNYVTKQNQAANTAAIRAKWQDCLKEVSKRRKDIQKYQKDDYDVFWQAAVDCAFNIMCMQGSGRLPAALLEKIDGQNQECLALLVEHMLDDKLRSQISSSLVRPLTLQHLKSTLSSQISKNIPVSDYIKNITTCRIWKEGDKVVQYVGGDDKFPTFVQKFNEAWQRYINKVAFADPREMEILRKSHFITALPTDFRAFVQNAIHEKFPGSAAPTTFQELVNLVKHEDTKFARTRLLQRNTQGRGIDSGRGSRGRGRDIGRGKHSQGVQKRTDKEGRGAGRGSGRGRGRWTHRGGRGGRGRGRDGGRDGGEDSQRGGRGGHASRGHQADKGKKPADFGKNKA